MEGGNSHGSCSCISRNHCQGRDFCSFAFKASALLSGPNRGADGLPSQEGTPCQVRGQTEMASRRPCRHLLEPTNHTHLSHVTSSAKIWRFCLSSRPRWRGGVAGPLAARRKVSLILRGALTTDTCIHDQSYHRGAVVCSPLKPIFRQAARLRAPDRAAAASNRLQLPSGALQTPWNASGAQEVTRHAPMPMPGHAACSEAPAASGSVQVTGHIHSPLKCRPRQARSLALAARHSTRVAALPWRPE